MTQDTVSQIKALLSQLTPEQTKELGLKQVKGKIYITERNQLRINVDKGIGRNKGATVGRYDGTQYFEKGMYAWLGGANVEVLTNKSKGTVSVSMTVQATEQEISTVEKYLSSTDFVIPKQSTDQQTPAPQTPAPSEQSKPAPEKVQDVTPVQEGTLTDVQLAAKLMSKLSISLDEAKGLVAQNRQEAELLIKG